MLHQVRSLHAQLHDYVRTLLSVLYEGAGGREGLTAHTREFQISARQEASWRAFLRAGGCGGPARKSSPRACLGRLIKLVAPGVPSLDALAGEQLDARQVGEHL